MRTFLAVLLIVSLFAIPAFTGDKEKAVDENAPACLKGFAGMLYGKLVKKLDNGFIFEVKDVEKFGNIASVTIQKELSVKRFVFISEK